MIQFDLRIFLKWVETNNEKKLDPKDIQKTLLNSGLLYVYRFLFFLGGGVDFFCL